MAANVNGNAPPRGGMPILSGPPPIIESSACRQCGKDFNILLRRPHPCGHCGYQYCSSCLSDGQALMPRRAGSVSTPTGPFAEIRQGLGLEERRTTNGYEVEGVCLPCLAMLQVTSAPISILRSLPLKRLKDYLAAYDIPCIGPKEKEDFVQAVVKARSPSTGCLSPESESFYRRKSVPKLGQPPSNRSSAPIPRARPPPTQSRPPPPTQARPPPPTQFRSPLPTQARPPANYRPPPPSNGVRPSQSRPPPPPTQARPPSAPARPPPTTKPPAPSKQAPPPIPTILSLVSLPRSYLASLSIGTLKAILYENHVRVDFSQVLEKEELISRVSELIVDERKRLERQRLAEEAEATGTDLHLDTSLEPTPRTSAELNSSQNVPTGPKAEIERGLCVVCQDEEATLAVVDCGHLAMCAHCSDLIMATSQECPLCRTRIVTPQRLIRIYRV